MKRCPACQRTYAEDNITFCLDDGTTLLSAEAGAADSPPTLRIPEPRVTDQPLPPFQPAPPPYTQPLYNQPRPAGFKFNSRILGMSGAGLLILGIFMPIISVFGLLTFSFFTFIQGMPLGGHGMSSDTAGVEVLFLLRILGILLLLTGIASLLLAWKNQLKALIATGILSLGLLTFTFIKLQALLSTAPPEVRMMVGVGWGFFVMVAAAIIMIVAGVRKDKQPTAGTDWNNNPPVNY